MIILTSDDKEEKIVLRIDLKGKNLDYFRQIQEFFASAQGKTLDEITKTDVIKYCLKKTHQSTNQFTIQLEEEYYTDINRYIQSTYFRRTYAIQNIDQFVARALSDFFKKIDEGSPSLKENPYEVLPQLNQKERELAMLIVQLSENKEEITKKKLLDQLNCPEAELDELLSSLLNNRLIDRMQFQEKTIYWIL